MKISKQRRGNAPLHTNHMTQRPHRPKWIDKLSTTGDHFLSFILLTIEILALDSISLIRK